LIIGKFGCGDGAPPKKNGGTMLDVHLLLHSDTRVRLSVVGVVRFGACQVCSGFCWVFNWGRLPNISQERITDAKPPRKERTDNDKGAFKTLRA